MNHREAEWLAQSAGAKKGPFTSSRRLICHKLSEVLIHFKKPPVLVLTKANRDTLSDDPGICSRLQIKFTRSRDLTFCGGGKPTLSLVAGMNCTPCKFVMPAVGGARPGEECCDISEGLTVLTQAVDRVFLLEAGFIRSDRAAESSNQIQD